MKITLFGANGRVGQLVIKQLLDGDHTVTAFVHGSDPFLKHSNLIVMQGDIYDPVRVAGAISESEIVLSTLGSWGTPKKNVLGSAMHSIIPAMEHKGISRIISLTGAAAYAPGDTPSIINSLNRLALSFVGRKILIDSESHIKQLSESNLEWTVLRSPVMNEKASHEFSLSNHCPKPWATIHRHAVATALVQQLTDMTYIKKSPFIVRK